MCKFDEIKLCHKKEGSDCLIKTQDSAKLKNDVQSLTPAQCCKINNYKCCLLIKVPVNGGCNPDGPKVAKFIGG